MKTVTLFRDFKEDHRTSMEVYADNLEASLNETDQTDFSFKSYHPHIGSMLGNLTEKANLKMRAARYISYPSQAKKAQGDINHIMDHGYAHLMTKLDPARTVITVHDIIPILAGKGLINGITDQRRARLAEWTSSFYRKAARIITISESTKQDLINYCGCDDSKIRVIYFGISSLYKRVPQKEKKTIREKLGLPQHKHLILVTGDAFYKNLPTSLKVMEMLQQRYGEDINLVRVGLASRQWSDLVSKSPFHAQITQIDYLDADRMPEIYNAVDCVLFPSWYEGFGWPPVEAMACGTPAVTSSVASLPEASGDAGLMSAPDDVKKLAGNISRLLDDHEFRESQIVKGLDHAKKFNWKQNATRTLDVYREITQEQIYS